MWRWSFSADRHHDPCLFHCRLLFAIVRHAVVYSVSCNWWRTLFFVARCWCWIHHHFIHWATRWRPGAHFASFSAARFDHFADDIGFRQVCFAKKKKKKSNKQIRFDFNKISLSQHFYSGGRHCKICKVTWVSSAFFFSLHKFNAFESNFILQNLFHFSSSRKVFFLNLRSIIWTMQIFKKR